MINLKNYSNIYFQVAPVRFRVRYYVINLKGEFMWDDAATRRFCDIFRTEFLPPSHLHKPQSIVSFDAPIFRIVLTETDANAFDIFS